MNERLRDRQEWAFFAALHRAAPRLNVTWWVLLVVRAVLPAMLAVAVGTVVAAVDGSDALGGPLTFVGVVFVALQVLPPIHQTIGANLGGRTGSWLNDELLAAAVGPPGIGHLEDADLAADLTMARDFDLGISGPPLHIAMDFVGGGLVELLGGLAAAAVLVRFSWWAPIVLVVAWGCTHWLLRESGVWQDRNTDQVRTAQRHTDYAYRLAVEAPAAKEVRLFGLSGWVVERFGGWSRSLHDLKYESTRLREKSVIWSLLIVLTANVAVLWAVASAAADGRLSLARVVVFAQAAFAAHTIAFGGLNWALDGASAPAAAVARLGEAMAARGALAPLGHAPAAAMPAASIRFRDVRFRYGNEDRDVLDGFNLTIPARSSLAIVGQNGAGKTTLAKLLCRLYDPQSGAIEVDGTDLRELDVDAWRARLTAVFQDFVRYELSLRYNVDPGGRAPDDTVLWTALRTAGADRLADLDTVLARGYPGGTDLSGGQWQRVALARALCAVQLGAGVVLLDEPTAQLDVRGEAEIFGRLLEATRDCTTILISHRFSTVRQADRICVVEGGRVIELGTHDELIALGGRYRTMYDLQAQRFVEVDDHGAEVTYESL